MVIETWRIDGNRGGTKGRIGTRREMVLRLDTEESEWTGESRDPPKFLRMF